MRKLTGVIISFLLGNIAQAGPCDGMSLDPASPERAVLEKTLREKLRSPNARVADVMRSGSWTALWMDNAKTKSEFIFTRRIQLATRPLRCGRAGPPPMKPRRKKPGPTVT